MRDLIWSGALLAQVLTSGGKIVLMSFGSESRGALTDGGLSAIATGISYEVVGSIGGGVSGVPWQ